MSIHYRCRCGQEVVLRPKEGVYLAVGIAIGLCVLNTALLLLLWAEVGGEDPKKAETGGTPKVATSEDDGTPGPAILREGTAAGDRSTGELEMGTQSGAGDRVDPGQRDETSTAPVTTEDTDDEGIAAPVEASTPPAAAQARIPEMSIIELRLPRPAGLDPVILPLLLERTPPDTLDRTLILLALCRWGGEAAPRASDQLRREAPRLFAAISPGPEEDPDLWLRRRDEGRNRGELAALEQIWESRWREIIRESAEDPTIRWIAALAEGGKADPVDVVILVDLSASMSDEIAQARAACRQMLPALLSARPTWRWGWIGYRDEVVDRTPLTADPTALLESLDRWRCDGGGDVPEALDEALFEAFRVGGFPWRPDAKHRFLVLGDAPPPYERIEGMVELARAAHASPEGFVVDCLGILREAEFEVVPGFGPLAEATEGIHHTIREGDTLGPIWWALLAGAEAPSWEDAPSRRP